MSSTAVADFPKTEEARGSKTPRIPPPHLDRLRQAKYDMQALLRRDVTEQQILEMYLDDTLAAYLAEKIASLRQSGPEQNGQPTERPGRRGRDKR